MQEKQELSKNNVSGKLEETKEIIETWKDNNENPKNIDELSKEDIAKLEARTRTVKSRVAEEESRLGNLPEAGDEKNDQIKLQGIKDKLDTIIFKAEKEMEGYFSSFLPDEIIGKMSNFQNEIWQKHLDGHSEIKKDDVLNFSSAISFVRNQEMNMVNPEENLINIKFLGKVEDFQSLYDQNIKTELAKLNLHPEQDYSVYDLKYTDQLFDKNDYEKAEDKERVIFKNGTTNDIFISKGKINF